MSTKAIARKVANITGITYSEALAAVRAAIIDLRIERVRYCQGLRAWIISAHDAAALTEMLTEARG